MKEFIVKKEDEGIRLDKYLHKILNEATTSFIYKMLRKKNITLNDSKATGSEHVICNDVIKIYLSDDTFSKFSVKKEIKINNSTGYDINKLVLYEDDNILLINKPAGLLSQKADINDTSVNDLCLSYVIMKNKLSNEDLKLYTPSICNRLDRNTSGIIIFAKNHMSATSIANALKDRTIQKFYRCIVLGNNIKSMRIDGYLVKNEKTNTVFISHESSDDSSYIITEYKPVRTNGRYTELDVHLVTGKTHQIRAHLASKGYPLLGDTKYGNKEINRELNRSIHLKHQMLHSYKLIMPVFHNELSYLSNKCFISNVPDEFEKIMVR